MTQLRQLLLAAFLTPFAFLLPCVAQGHYLTGGPHSGHRTVIIFIHGYRGSNASWDSGTQGRKSLPLLIGEDPALAGFADVYIFEYQAGLGDPNAQLPGSIADKLLAEVRTMTRFNDPDRKDNIVLVCHSMGGLIGFSMIEQMQTDQIVKKLIKMVFTYGTPYRGTSLSRAEFAAVLSPNPQLYALLQIKTNPYLNEFQYKYKHSTTLRSIDLYCAYEIKAMPHIGIVVDEASATAPCVDPGNEKMPGTHVKVVKIPGNHEQLVRPDSPAYPDNFDSLKAAIIESHSSWNEGAH